MDTRNEGKNPYIVYRMWRPAQNRIKGLSSGPQPRSIHPRPEARAHRNGRLSRPAEGWKGTSKKSLTAPRRSGKVLPRAERRQGGRRKAAGATPQAGTLRTGYWTDGITFYYQLASEASADRTLRSWLPRIYNFFFFLCQDRGMDDIPLFFNGEFDPGSG